MNWQKSSLQRDPHVSDYSHENRAETSQRHRENLKSLELMQYQLKFEQIKYFLRFR